MANFTQQRIYAMLSAGWAVRHWQAHSCMVVANSGLYVGTAHIREPLNAINRAGDCSSAHYKGDFMEDIEEFAGGFILVDYSGYRGKFGAAYCGPDGVWRDQPIGIVPFSTKELAENARAPKGN